MTIECRGNGEPMKALVGLSVMQTDALNDAKSIDQLHSNVIQMCLLIEGVAVCSTVLGTAFQPLLIDVLYPLLEKLGSENARVSRCALLALSDVATSCGIAEGNIAVLLHSNADYLVNAVSLRLRCISAQPEAPSVLRVALMYGGAAMVPLLNDVILEVSCLLCISYNSLLMSTNI